MIEISFNKVNKSFGFGNILENLNFEIKTNEKIALIGQNGCGKSTILKLISREELPSSGNIFIRKGLSIGFLKQEIDISLNEYLVKDILYNSFENIIRIKEKLEKETINMSLLKGKELEKSINKFSLLQEKYIELGGYEIESKIDKIVYAFKLEKLLDLKYKLLSGGEKTIVNLVCLLLKEPDLLLLDEPTNHLDIDMIEWLEKYLNNYKGTFVIVSHDRYFLDKVINKIVLIEKQKQEIFYGNYSYFVMENEKRIMQEFNDYKNQQKQIDAMKKSIAKLKEFGRLAFPLGEPFFKRAASIQKRLDKIEVLDKPKTTNLNINFEVNKRSGNDILSISKLTLGYDKPLLNNISLNIYKGDKICLMGKNGTGKSTLIKEIISNNNPSIKLGSNIKIGYISQDFIFENECLNVFEEARKYFEGEDSHLRSALHKFMFYSDNIFKRISKLSGGEKLRLKLFCLMQKDTNFLILDEPTNHLDISTKEVLEDALNEYKGTILFISHDRYFINKIASKIFMIENQNIKIYNGNYDYLLSKKKEMD